MMFLASWSLRFINSYLVFLMISVVGGNTLVKVQLLDFYNSDHRLLDGTCCDNVLGICLNSCDNWFEICLTAFPAKDWSQCIYNAKTPVLPDGDDIKFPGYGKMIGNNLLNPLNFIYDGPFVGFGFLANVWDEDGIIGGRDDKTDEYKSNVQVKPDKHTAITLTPHSIRLTGQQSNLGIIVRVKCVKDWYDEKCSTYCVARDDERGHYTCDQQNGNKICMIGWTGYNCAEAFCHRLCDRRNGNCSIPDGCDCFPGWQDNRDGTKKCGQCIPKTGCYNGYCILGNDCHCNAYWFGERCTMDNNTCRNFPCRNGGDCLNTGLDSYQCICAPGFTGINCTTGIDLCTSKPCLFGSCTNFRTSYTCTCQSGYTGKNCDKNIDDCDSNPCQNNGHCIDEIASHNCSCTVGYDGKNCENNINECMKNKCQHGSRCVDGIGNYTCECRTGYTGRYCEIDIDDCLSKPCVNGLCIDLVNSFRCNCSSSHSGRLCNNNENDCLPNPCNLGTCTDLDNDYNCSCPAGFTGKNCEKDIDECLPGICNNGTCKDGPNYYNCTCNVGFTGKNCSTNINDCDVNPCLNNGVCIDGIHDYICKCQPGWTGKNCNVDIDDCVRPCDPQTHSCSMTPLCMNAGKCVDAVNNFTCDCADGFEGRICDEEIDYCSLNNPCENEATCINRGASYVCNCKLGFTGRNCSTNIDDCLTNPCLNGNCTDGIAFFTCNCPIGYEGQMCEKDIDNCDTGDFRNMANIPEGRRLTSEGFCGKHGQCVDKVNSIYCNCSTGYQGEFCNDDINECKNNPCGNGDCYENPDQAGYTCSCYPGFNGTNCDTEINECEFGNKCCGESTCVDELDGYSCRCPQGFKGIHCCSKTSWCDNHSTCNQNGRCKEVFTSGTKESIDYNCDCNIGYTGKRCDIDINECLSGPCHNGATCLNTVGAFECICPVGKTGSNCETEIDDCEGIKCKNGFECIDGSNEFECNCPKTGYASPFCEDINECNQIDICPSDRQCINRIGDYECVCLDGWTGYNCRESIDDCVDNNCTKSSTRRCVDLHQAFQCECFQKWHGETCSERKENSSASEDECGCLYGACYLDEERIKKCLCDIHFEGEKCREPRMKANTGKKNVLGTSATVGIAIGVVVLIGAVIVLPMFLRRRNRNYHNNLETVFHENVPNKKAPSYHLQFENKLFEEGGDLMFTNPAFNLGLTNPWLYTDDDKADEE